MFVSKKKYKEARKNMIVYREFFIECMKEIDPEVEHKKLWDGTRFNDLYSENHLTICSDRIVVIDKFGVPVCYCLLIDAIEKFKETGIIKMID